MSARSILNRIMQHIPGPSTFFTCDLLRTGLVFFPSSLHPCCIHPVVISNTISISNDRLDKEIMDAIYNFRKSSITENIDELPDNCRTCQFLYKTTYRKIKREYFLHHLVINSTLKCNIRCIYCEQNNKGSIHKTHYSVLPILQAWFAENMISPSLRVSFAGGEPTIMPEFDETLDLIMKNATQYSIEILSNMVRHSSTLETLLNEGKGSLLCSLDAATPETYRRIKGVPAYDTVWNNLCRINRKDAVKLKMIILPENFHESTLFIDKAKENGFLSVVVDVDQHATDDYPSAIVEKVVNFFMYGEKCGLTVQAGGNIIVRGRNVKQALEKCHFSL